MEAGAAGAARAFLAGFRVYLIDNRRDLSAAPTTRGDDRPATKGVRNHASHLDASTAYTVWAVIFNRPKYCAATPCGLGDLPVAPGHDPRVQASMTYVTGGYSGADGTLLQEGLLYRARNGVKPTETLFDPGLMDTKGSEIHFVLRGHGPDPGNPFLAIGSYDAGCSEDNPCGDHQVSVHVPRQ